MDHALRTISYIADIGDVVVLMARRRFVPHEMEEAPKINRTPKMICHVFESEEARFIAQSIGQAFQVAYMEFLKANGIEDHSFVKEMDYQEVLNSQEIFGDELQMFAKKEMQKEVIHLFLYYTQILSKNLHFIQILQIISNTRTTLIVDFGFFFVRWSSYFLKIQRV